jgi:pilus retraction protein PilT
MEKLNEYLQTLMSTCSYELHLEPNRIPYIVSASGSADVANAPLLGTQISTLIFPLIPMAVKMELPNKDEIEFAHAHNLGNFNFQVRKSPAGFKVTIRPIISEAARSNDAGIDLPHVEPDMFKPSAPTSMFSNSVNQTPAAAKIEDFAFESSSLNFENETAAVEASARATELEIEEAEKFLQASIPAIETVPFNDPAFQTVFSDTSTYEPPGRRDDFDFLTAENSNAQDDFAAQTNFAPAENDFSQQNQPSQQSFNQFPTEQTQFQPQQTQFQQPQYQSQEQFQQPQQQFQQAPQQFVQPQQQFQPQQQQFVQAPQQQFYQMPVPEAAAVFEQARANPRARASMDSLFHQMAELGASDLHMSVSMPPMVRKDGKMQKLDLNAPQLSADEMKTLLTSIMPSKNQEEFERRKDTDFAYEIPELARFRANIFADRKGMGGVFRIIPTKILTAEQLGLSPAIMSLCNLSKGLVVVTGPTGSGKSTTLCAMVDHINKSREDHIITIEDPIEFTHENQSCLVNQREVHNHTDSFKDALRAALREDPDILLVGEMRDLETVSIAIETAETGHLVFGTLHTTTACSTVDRIIDQFPADRQQQIRVMLSESLKGVISQTLLPKKGGGRIAALEVLIVTPAISNLIREGKTFQIPSAMQTGKQLGMVVLNDALFALVQKGLVEPRDAYIKAVDKPGFESMLTRNNMRM